MGLLQSLPTGEVGHIAFTPAPDPHPINNCAVYLHQIAAAIQTRLVFMHCHECSLLWLHKHVTDGNEQCVAEFHGWMGQLLGGHAALLWGQP